MTQNSTLKHFRISEPFLRKQTRLSVRNKNLIIRNVPTSQIKLTNLVSFTSMLDTVKTCFVEELNNIKFIVKYISLESKNLPMHHPL